MYTSSKEGEPGYISNKRFALTGCRPPPDQKTDGLKMGQSDTLAFPNLSTSYLSICGQCVKIEENPLITFLSNGVHLQTDQPTNKCQ